MKEWGASVDRGVLSHSVVEKGNLRAERLLQVDRIESLRLPVRPVRLEGNGLLRCHSLIMEMRGASLGGHARSRHDLRPLVGDGRSPEMLEGGVHQGLARLGTRLSGAVSIET